jgi:hypothetical protein
MSSPRRRIHSPGCGTWFTVTASPSGAHSSCITTASAPAGSGAPVKMRAAVPGASVWPTLPAGMRCATAAPLCRRRHIGAAHGVAVHRGVVQRRHVDGGTQAGGQHPSGGAWVGTASVSVAIRAPASRRASASS